METGVGLTLRAVVRFCTTLALYPSRISAMVELAARARKGEFPPATLKQAATTAAG